MCRVLCPVSRGFHPRLWSGHRAAVSFDGGVYLCIPLIPYFVGIVISVGCDHIPWVVDHIRGLLTHGYVLVTPTAFCGQNRGAVIGLQPWVERMCNPRNR